MNRYFPAIRFSVILLFCFPILLNAQSWYYTFGSTTGNTYTNLASPTTLIAADVNDEISASTSIGFTFAYNGIDYTNFSVSSNGFVNLGGALTESYPANTLDSDITKEILAPLWDDLETNTGGSIGYELSGSSGNYILKIEFKDMDFSGYGTSMNFQVWLYEATYQVEFRYGSMGSWSAQSASIGINDESANRFLSITPGSPPTSSIETENIAIATNANIISGLNYSFTKGSNWAWWKGVTSTDWATGTNWYNGTIPTSAQNVTITRNKSYYPIIDETAYANGLVIGDGSSLKITTGADLTISNNLWVGGLTSGEFWLEDGQLTITNDFISLENCLVDIDGGTMNILDSWQGTNPNAKGIIELSGGAINIAKECQFAFFGVFGFMEGDFVLTVGNKFKNSYKSSVSVTGGTLILTASSNGKGVISSSSSGRDAHVNNLIINCDPADVVYMVSTTSSDRGVIVNNDFTLQSGTAETIRSGQRLSKLEVAGTFSMADNCLFRDGTESGDVYNVANFDFGLASTYELYGTDQNVPAATFGNLKISTGGNKTTTGDATIAGDMMLEAGDFIIAPGHHVSISDPAK